MGCIVSMDIVFVLVKNNTNSCRARTFSFLIVLGYVGQNLNPNHKLSPLHCPKTNKKKKNILGLLDGLEFLVDMEEFANKFLLLKPPI